MTDDVLTHRARIEEQVGGRTLIDALAGTATAYADEAAYSDKHDVPEGETWRTLTGARPGSWRSTSRGR
ncbi:hypothetical protein [Nocardioides sp. B-3]|uniref:hypothetical protein n=1 Tax=Nocardioides sp. B-3 TaxID=2895565 RepID=UPI002152566B|nr:hypothetical protein [Nocardioides sp. B-3]UUZ61894.1 hypothetical protein LP418_16590 [Nocardioides sp. B-3]